MLTRILNHSFVHAIIILALVAGMGVCVFPEYISFFLRPLEKFAVQVMIGYLGLGLLFLIIKQPRLMFTSFGCCAALAIYLKFSLTPEDNPTPKLEPSASAKNLTDTLKIVHFSVSDADEEVENTIEKILSTEADLLSIQEVTPIWDSLLESELAEKYPYHHTIVDLGMFGQAVYSKFELTKLDTFFFGEVPNLTGCLFLNEGTAEIRFISSHTYPAFNRSSYLRVKDHLRAITEYINKINTPIFAFGNYHVVPWSPEILEFRDSTQLQDSRRGFIPTYTDGTINFFDIPLDHIFYSKHFQCLDFETLSGKTSKHLGIQGIYQVLPSYHAEKTTQ